MLITLEGTMRFFPLEGNACAFTLRFLNFPAIMLLLFRVVLLHFIITSFIFFLGRETTFIDISEVTLFCRDVNVQLKEEWLVTRDTSNDSKTLSNFIKFLEETEKFSHQNGSISNG